MARRFPREFHVRAIELVRISDRPLSQVARELGISNSALYRWGAEDDFAKAEAEKAAGVVPVLDADEQAELVRLRREVRRLETENEILKRAAAYFAKENVLPKHLSD
ncbi:transposase [Leifsonia sp. fls2-241-R2A-40a]|uniref:transposase n=1 Tax=Leifsonia sp. fls2-241-R2A-40a TaxID=3040290 RepID=UPI00255088FD|nr:transposase [Leifsonia sp. fls2-241-R2A-40a]